MCPVPGQQLLDARDLEPWDWRGVALSRVKSTSRWVWCLSGTLLAYLWPPAGFWSDCLWTNRNLVPILPVFLAGARELEPPGPWERPRSQETLWGGCHGLEVEVTMFGLGWKLRECVARCPVGGHGAP